MGIGVLLLVSAVQGLDRTPRGGFHADRIVREREVVAPHELRARARKSARRIASAVTVIVSRAPTAESASPRSVPPASCARKTPREVATLVGSTAIETDEHGTSIVARTKPV
jgi:hypothetical protein